MSVFAAQAEKVSDYHSDDDFEKREMYLKQFVIVAGSPFCKHTIRECGVRNKYHCLVVGIELTAGDSLHKPDVNLPLNEGDILWVVGEKDNLAALFAVNQPEERKNDVDEE